MKKLFKEFKEFINKGNALALAIGVIIGGAFSSIVNAINEKIISPLIGWILGDYDLSQSLVTVLTTEKVYDENGVFVEEVVTNAIYWGAFIQAVIDFLLIAIVLFTIVKVVSNFNNAGERTREKIRKSIEKRMRKGKEVTEEEKAIVSEPVPAPAPEPVVSEEVLLLKEIRDLLASKKDENKE